jgi:predicted RNA-binding protein with RPS1 domain
MNTPGGPVVLRWLSIEEQKNMNLSMKERKKERNKESRKKERNKEIKK